MKKQTSKKFAKFFTQLGVVVISTVLTIQIAFAQATASSSNCNDYTTFQGVLSVINGTDCKATAKSKNNLPDFSTIGHAQASYEPGASNITSAILFTVDLLKYLLGTISVVMIIISGVRLITSVKNVEDVASKQKENMKYAIIGLIVVIAADAFIKQVFYGEYGEVYRTISDVQTAAQNGTNQIKGIYNFIEAFLGALSVFMIILAGARMITSGGKEEAQEKAKKQITWAVAGLIITALAEFVVKDVIFPNQGTSIPDTQKAAMIIVNLTNFVSGFIAVVAIAMFMYGGFLYVVDFGKGENVEKTKKIFQGAVIGILLAAAAFGIVNTVIKFTPQHQGEVQTQQISTMSVDLSNP